MPEGGNWKDLFKACREGQLELIHYHLRMGVDPNYQHPEFFTSPLFEAIRFGQIEAVRILLNGTDDDKKNVADPTRREDSSEDSPLEIALEEGQHDIVDLLLSKITNEKDRSACQRIFVTGTNNLELLEHLLRLGQDIILLEQQQEKQQQIITQDDLQRLKESTKNKKIRFQTKDDVTFDIWIHRATKQEQDIPLFPVMMKEKINVRNRLVLIHDMAQIQNVMKWLETAKQGDDDALQSEPERTALAEPSSWWSRATYGWWCNQWYDTLGWLATPTTDNDETKDNNIHGACFDFKRRRVFVIS